MDAEELNIEVEEEELRVRRSLHRKRSSTGSGGALSPSLDGEGTPVDGKSESKHRNYEDLVEQWSRHGKVLLEWKKYF